MSPVGKVIKNLNDQNQRKPPKCSQTYFQKRIRRKKHKIPDARCNRHHGYQELGRFIQEAEQAKGQTPKTAK